MSTENTDDFGSLSGLLELQEAQRLFKSHVLSPQESRSGRIAVPQNGAPSLALVENKGERKITAADVEAIIAEVAAKCMAAGVPQSKIDALRAQMLADVGAPISHLSEMRESAYKEAEALVSESGHGVEHGPEQISKLNEEIKNFLDPYMTEEQKKKEAALERAIAEARSEEEKIAAEKALNKFHKDINEHNVPTDTPAGLQTHNEVKQRTDKIDDIIKAREENLKQRTRLGDDNAPASHTKADAEASQIHQKSENTLVVADASTEHLMDLQPIPPAPGSGGRHRV